MEACLDGACRLRGGEVGRFDGLSLWMSIS
jgi:hypothetical protein